MECFEDNTYSLIYLLCACSENVTFGLMSAEQMRKQSHIHVVNKGLYDQDGSKRHVPYGVLDHKMVRYGSDKIAISCSQVSFLTPD